MLSFVAIPIAWGDGPRRVLTPEQTEMAVNVEDSGSGGWRTSVFETGQFAANQLDVRPVASGPDADSGSSPHPGSSPDPSQRGGASQHGGPGPYRGIARPPSPTPQAADESEMLPLARPSPLPGVELRHKPDDSVSLMATEADLVGVLRMIAEHHELNLIVAPGVSGPVTVQIREARLEEVLDAILGVAGFTWHREGSLLYVTAGSTPSINPQVQGRVVQVYPLNYVAAKDVEAVATGLLSPIGSAYISESSQDDQLRTRERLIVEDTRAVQQRIAQCIAQIDVMPRQVLVEAHVLQVSLNNDDRHGVNWRGLARLSNSEIELEGAGFANDTSDSSGSPSLALRFRGSDMTSLIEWIEQNTNSRTLASPKLSVVNHQEAKIQIGQRLPFSVATTTENTTVQSVQFLEVGVVLTVEPTITDDGHVLMRVLPKVSGGKIAANGFPEEETTEVQTTILMPDGGGVVIGGLIREEEIHFEATVPLFGRVPLVGRLFRRQTNEMRRNEVVVALVTHILSDCQACVRDQECMQLQRIMPEHVFSTHDEPMISLPVDQRTVPQTDWTVPNDPGLDFEGIPAGDWNRSTLSFEPVTTATP